MAESLLRDCTYGGATDFGSYFGGIANFGSLPFAPQQRREAAS